jgi:hypothetical protein
MAERIESVIQVDGRSRSHRRIVGAVALVMTALALIGCDTEGTLTLTREAEDMTAPNVPVQVTTEAAEATATGGVTVTVEPATPEPTATPVVVDWETGGGGDASEKLREAGQEFFEFLLRERVISGDAQVTVYFPSPEINTVIHLGGSDNLDEIYGHGTPTIIVKDESSENGFYTLSVHQFRQSGIGDADSVTVNEQGEAIALNKEGEVVGVRVVSEGADGRMAAYFINRLVLEAVPNAIRIEESMVYDAQGQPIAVSWQPNKEVSPTIFTTGPDGTPIGDYLEANPGSHLRLSAYHDSVAVVEYLRSNPGTSLDEAVKKVGRTPGFFVGNEFLPSYYLDYEANEWRSINKQDELVRRELQVDTTVEFVGPIGTELEGISFPIRYTVNDLFGISKVVIGEPMILDGGFRHIFSMYELYKEQNNSEIGIEEYVELLKRGEGWVLSYRPNGRGGVEAFVVNPLLGVFFQLNGDNNSGTEENRFWLTNPGQNPREYVYSLIGANEAGQLGFAKGINKQQWQEIVALNINRPEEEREKRWRMRIRDFFGDASSWLIVFSDRTAAQNPNFAVSYVRNRLQSEAGIVARAMNGAGRATIHLSPAEVFNNAGEDYIIVVWSP